MSSKTNEVSKEPAKGSDIADIFEKKLNLHDDQPIKQRLTKLPCPMTWDLESLCLDEKETRTPQANLNDEEEICGPEDKYRFLPVLTYAIIEFHEKNYKNAAEMVVKYLEEEDSDDKAIQRDSHMLCICYATLSWCYYMMGLEDQCISYLQLAEKYFNSKSSNYYKKIKALVCKGFGERGRKHGLNQFKELLECDKDNPEYHFFVGKLLGQVRRFVFPPSKVTIEEIHHLERAYQDEMIGEACSVILARSYADFARGCPYTERAKYFEKATTMAEHIIFKGNLSKLSGRSLARLLNILRPRTTSFEIYREVAELALKKMPDNILVNDYIGRCYFKFFMYTKAAECFEKSLPRLPRNFVLFLASRFFCKEEVAVKPLVEKYKKIYKSDKDLQTIYAGISEYYLLAMNDVEMACEYFILMSRYGPIPDTIYAQLSRGNILDLMETRLEGKSLVEKEVLRLIRNVKPSIGQQKKRNSRY